MIYFSDIYIAPNNPNDRFMCKTICTHFWVLSLTTLETAYASLGKSKILTEITGFKCRGGTGRTQYCSPSTKFPWLPEGRINLQRCKATVQETLWLTAFPAAMPPSPPSLWLFPESCTTHNDRDSLWWTRRMRLSLNDVKWTTECPWD